MPKALKIFSNKFALSIHVNFSVRQEYRVFRLPLVATHTELDCETSAVDMSSQSKSYPSQNMKDFELLWQPLMLSAPLLSDLCVV